MKKIVFISFLFALSLVSHSPNCQTLRAFASNTGPYCVGATVQLLGSHNLTNNSAVQYRWKGPNGYAAQVQNPNDAYLAGNYTLIVQSGNKIDSTKTEVIYKETIEKPNIFGLTTLCENATIELQVPYYKNAGYEWKNPFGMTVSLANSLFVSGVKDSLSGFYSVDIKGVCYTKNNKIEVKIEESPKADIETKVKKSYCVGESLELNAKTLENVNYEWFNAGNQKISSEKDLKIPILGEYDDFFYLKVTKNGCSSPLKSIEIPLIGLAQNNIIANKQKLCEGETLKLNTTFKDSLLHYHWTFPNSETGVNERQDSLRITNIKPNQSGIYILKIEKQGCISKPSKIEIQVISKPKLVYEKEIATCGTSNIELPLKFEGNPPFKLSYQIGKDEEKIIVTNDFISKIKLQNTVNQYFKYNILESDNGLCKIEIKDSTALKVLKNGNAPIVKEDEFALEIGELDKKIDFLANDIFSKEDSIIITQKPQFGEIIKHKSGSFSYERGDNNEKSDVFEYKICNSKEVCNPQCATAKVKIELENDPFDPKVFVPDAITPNNDEKNDVLYLKGLEKYPNAELTIFNRWGNLVFQEKPYNQNWDATKNNQALENGAYYYVLRVNQANKRVLKGVIYVFRE